MTKLLHILVICIICTSSLTNCTNYKTKENAAIPNIFTNTINLNGKVLINSDSLIDPWEILTMDSLIIVGNQKGTPALEIYDLNGKRIKNVVKRGKAFDELRMIGTMQPNYKKDCFYIYDLFDRKILKFQIGVMLNDTGYKPMYFADIKKFDLHTDYYDKVYVLDEGFLAESRCPKGRILKFNNNGDNVKYFIKFPKQTDSSISDQENAELYSLSAAFNPNMDKMAIATMSAGMIDLLSVQPSSLDSIWSYQEFLPEGLKRIYFDSSSHLAFTPNSKSGYTDVVATNEFVYAAYSGKMMSDQSYSFSNNIRVMSWDGRRRYHLILDKSVHKISVSKDNSTIYATSMNKKGNPEIVSFNIKNVFK